MRHVIKSFKQELKDRQGYFNFSDEELNKATNLLYFSYLELKARGLLQNLSPYNKRQLTIYFKKDCGKTYYFNNIVLITIFNSISKRYKATHKVTEVHKKLSKCITGSLPRTRISIIHSTINIYEKKFTTILNNNIFKKIYLLLYINELFLFLKTGIFTLSISIAKLFFERIISSSRLKLPAMMIIPTIPKITKHQIILKYLKTLILMKCSQLRNSRLINFGEPIRC